MKFLSRRKKTLMTLMLCGFI